MRRNSVQAGLVERAEDWVWSSAWGRLHPDDPRALPLCDWPIPRPVDWLDRVNQALTSRIPTTPPLKKRRPSGGAVYRISITKRPTLRPTASIVPKLLANLVLAPIPSTRQLDRHAS